MIIRPVSPVNAKFFTGWVAPNGDFYPCAVTDHDYVCWDLAPQFNLYSNRMPERYSYDLTEHSWIRISTKGLCLENEAKLEECTQKQMDTLFDIYYLWEKEDPGQPRDLKDALDRFKVVDLIL